MADSSDGDSSFSYSKFYENIQEPLDQDIESDISISPVSSPDVSPLSSDNESENEDDENVTWRRELRKPVNIAFSEQVGAAFELSAEEKEIDFFLKFFSEDLMSHLVRETNLYADKCIANKPDPKWKPVTLEELKAYFGINIVFSIVQIPSYTLAWTSKWPFSLPAIPQIMQRERYEKINQYFHCNDVSQNPPRRAPGHDKLCHVRPVLDEIGDKCVENYHPFREQSVDEGMIAFKGRLSFKQYLPAKPTKFGIKVWERASPKNGYCHEFQVYTGKVDGARTEEGLGYRVVKDLTRKIIGKGHHVYMDNFFSSPTLFNDLYDEQIYCCGTVRGNRKGMPEEMKKIKLKNHGDSLLMQKKELCAAAWKDKKIVYYLSTNCDPSENISVQRKQKDGTIKDVPSPVIGQMYNKYMFGVDRADQLRMVYSTCRKALKWWKYLFWFCVDVAIVNSFICMKESPNHKQRTRTGREIVKTQLNYRMELARQLIGNFRGARKRKIVSNTDNCGQAHWPVKIPKRGRCKQCTSEKRRHEIYIQCKTCQIYLCVDNGCFEKWHVQNMQ